MDSFPKFYLNIIMLYYTILRKKESGILSKYIEKYSIYSINLPKLKHQAKICECSLSGLYLLLASTRSGFYYKCDFHIKI